MRIYKSEKSYVLPELDLLTFLFESDNTAYRPAPDTTVFHAEADNPSNCITKADFVPYFQQLAHVLRTTWGIGADGLDKDVVVLFTSGNISVPVAFYGIICAGGVVSAASPSFTPFELARQISHGDSKLLICTPDLFDTATKAAEKAGLDPDRILVLGARSPCSLSTTDNTNLVHTSTPRLPWTRITDRIALQKSLAVLLYSSGTTGPPKGVMLSHLNLVTEVFLPSKMNRDWFEAQGPNYPAPPPVRALAHLPIAHVSGMLAYLIGPLVAAGTVFWMPRYAWRPFLAHMKAHRITSFFTVPSVYLRIVKSRDVTDQFGSVVAASTGSAPMDGELQTGASRRMGGGAGGGEGKGGVAAVAVAVGQTWGLTETTGAVTMMPRGETDTSGSISPPLPNMELRIVDADGTDVPEGSPGELIVRGDLVTQGYYKNPEATAAAFRAGWFRTGDVAVARHTADTARLRGRQPRIYIVDRAKELIKYKGLQIAPAELEAVLAAHPRIAEAAVIGVPLVSIARRNGGGGFGEGGAAEGEGDKGSEVPRAYVVRAEMNDAVGVSDAAGVSEVEVQKWVEERCSPYKRLRGGVVFVREIPKTASGKILRRELRERAKGEMRAEGPRL